MLGKSHFHHHHFHFFKKKQPTETFSTIPYQGIFCSAAHFAKYKEDGITAPTGEHITSHGRNNFPPVNLLVNPYIGPEIKDINNHPFETKSALLNPLKILSHTILRLVDIHDAIDIAPADKQDGSIKSQALNVNEISIAQETDIASHYEKYKAWKEAKVSDNLILWGDSRGAATTFSAAARYKYPETKLIILEGCFASFEDLLHRRFYDPISRAISYGLSLFTQYNKEGISPEKSVDNFPENVPVVFITSKSDWVVPCESTEKLAHALNSRGKNDVYLLKLEHSGHASYIFDDATDRGNYLALIHAIYKKYHIPCDARLAQKGAPLLMQTLLPKDKCLDSEMRVRM